MIKTVRFSKIEETLNTLEKGFIKWGLFIGGKILLKIKNDIAKIIESGQYKSLELPSRKGYLDFFKLYLKSGIKQGMYFADVQIEKKRSQGENAKFSLVEKGWDEWRPPREYVIPVNAIKWVDKWTHIFGEEYYNDLTDAFQKELAASIASSEGIKGAMVRFEKLFEGQGFNQARLEVIARTNATTAFNQGHLEFIYENKDFVPAVQFMAILDDRVTDICESRHGKIIMTDDADGIAENTPPLHYNCRSLLSPITKFEWEDIQDRGWGEKQNDLNNQTPREAIDWSHTATVASGFGNIEKVIKNHSKIYNKDEVNEMIIDVSNKFEKEKVESNKYFKAQIEMINEAYESFKNTESRINENQKRKIENLEKEIKIEQRDSKKKIKELKTEYQKLSQIEVKPHSHSIPKIKHSELKGVNNDSFHLSKKEKNEVLGISEELKKEVGIVKDGIDNHIQDDKIHRKIKDSGTGSKDLWSAKKINGELKKKTNKNHFHPFYGGGIQNSPSENIYMHVMTGQNLNACKIVVLNNEKKAIYADKNKELDVYKICGITCYSAKKEKEIKIQRFGKIKNDTWNWNIGVPLFLNNNGEITEISPVDGYTLILGYSISKTEFIWDIKIPIKLI